MTEPQPEEEFPVPDKLEKTPPDQKHNSEFDDLEDILEYVPADKRNAAQVTLLRLSRRYSGPIPEASQLVKYSNIDPSLPGRIMSMAENQAKHRQSIEKTLAEGDVSSVKRGQNYALASLCLLASLASAMMYLGYVDTAKWVIIVGIVSVVGIFVTGKWMDKGHDIELEE